MARALKVLPSARLASDASRLLNGFFDNARSAPAADSSPRPSILSGAYEASPAPRLRPASAEAAGDADAGKTDVPKPSVNSSLARAAAALGIGSVILALGTAFQQGLGAAFAAAGFPAAMMLTHDILERAFAGSENAPSGLKLWMLSTAAGLGFAAYAYTVALLSPWAAGASVAAAVLGILSMAGRAPGAKAADRPGKPLAKDGFLDLSRDEKGKLQLSLKEQDLDKPMMLNAMLEKGVGENFLYSMSPLAEALVYFHRSGDRIQLVRKNMAFRAEEGSADAKVVERSFADSVLASVPIASKDEKAKSLTIGLEDVLLSDLFDLQNTLSDYYPGATGYSLSKELSSVASAKAFPRNAELSAELLFSNPSPAHRLPVPDARNVGLRLRYSFSALPEPGFQARAADERVGYFTTVYRDFTDLNSSQAADTPHGRLINRWRLEKQYPGDKVSPVKRPIVWWMENNVPKEYRQAVREGVLKWNEAFEKLGYKDAIVVRQQPDPGAEPADQAEREFDPADVRYNVIHWFTGSDADIAFAQWRTDPRTGEIYNGHVNFSLQVLDGSGYRGMRDMLESHEEHGHKHGPACRFGHEIARTLEAMKASGLSEELSRKFTHELIVSYIVHEFGHALGLRHNFAATDLRSLDEISHAKDGIVSQSVMDYAAISIPAEENKGGTYVQTELGPYDYLAIEYGYMPVDGLSPEKAHAALSRVAGRVGEPGLEFATDEQVDGTDPYVNQFDFGPEPLEYAKSSVERARKVIEAMARRQLKEGEDYGTLRRHFRHVFRGQMVRAFRLAVPYVGGIHVNRVRAGQNAGKLPYEAVAGEKQREALQFLYDNLFSDQAMSLPDGLLARLAPDLRDGPGSESGDAAVLPYEEMVTDVRKWAMDALLSPERLKRMAESRQLGEADYFSVRELFADLSLSIWAEVYQKKLGEALAISPLRRRAQSAHVEHLIGILQGPSGLVEDEKGGLRSPSNPYSSEAVSAASAELTAIGGRIAELLGKAQKSKKASQVDLDPVVLEHLEHVLWRIQTALH